MTKFHSKFSKALACAVAAAPLVAAAPAFAQEDTSQKFTDIQKLGYLGQTSKSELTQSVIARLNAQTTAPALETTADRFIFWHNVLLDSIALDHTGSDEFGGLPPFVQGGPGRTSRALAMVQIAVYDAMNAFEREFFNYNNGVPRARNASMDVAIAFASFEMQRALFPWREDVLTSIFESDLDQIGLATTDREFLNGRRVGVRAARAMLRARSNDNSTDAEPSFGDGGRVADGTATFRGGNVNDGAVSPFDWTPDPNTPEFDVLNFNVSLGAFWGGVTPFTLSSGDQFRIPPPPEPGSEEYIAAYNQVAARGGSPENVNTPSTSTPATRFNGNYWGYDAVPLLGTPPRAYNQYAIGVILQELGCDDPNDILVDDPESCDADPMDIARPIAMVNAAIGDTGVAAWDSKYFYNYWRPVTGIRIDDGVADTQVDPTWDPVGASIINVELPDGEDFIRPTPPFPAYPSGHATFGAVTMQILADFFGDDTPYTWVSDEYNGEGVDPSGTPRPLVPILFNTLTDAQISNGISRIDNGVHWAYDDTQGQALGENIASWILNDIRAFQPVRERRPEGLRDSE